jgi:hypothetical protein
MRTTSQVIIEQSKASKGEEEGLGMCFGWKRGMYAPLAHLFVGFLINESSILML